MVIPPGDYQGHLCSGVGLPSSLRVLTLTPGRTWALSSPYLRPGSSHQVPSLSETPVSGSQTGLVCSSHHKGSRANYRGGDLWGSVGPHAGAPQSSFRHLTLPPVRTGFSPLPNCSPGPSHQGAQCLQDPDVRKSDHACFAHSVPRTPRTDNRDGLL